MAEANASTTQDTSESLKGNPAGDELIDRWSKTHMENPDARGSKGNQAFASHECESDLKIGRFNMLKTQRLTQIHKDKNRPL